MKVSALQKVRSYFSPVTLWKGSSPVSPVLELLLYQGRFQLATTDALYSDGGKYRPLVAGFGAVKRRLREVRSALVLGAGIGSAVNVLRRFGARPSVTLVELDEVVARWTRDLLRTEDQTRVRIVVEDARIFICKEPTRYDLIIVDVFTGREAASFVTASDFLQACKAHLEPGGIFLLNYMQNPGDDIRWEEKLSRIRHVFPCACALAFGPNRVVVWEGSSGD